MEKLFKCCICGGVFYGYGNNPYPVVKEEGARCCDDCDSNEVIRARLFAMLNREGNDD